MHSLNLSQRSAMGVKVAWRRRLGGPLGAALAAVLLCGLGCVVADPEYCATTSDCARIHGTTDGSMYRCHPMRHLCVTNDPLLCFGDVDCLDFSRPYCDLVSSRCVPCTIADDSSCARFRDRPKCGVALSGGTQCIGCATHLDCRAAAPICDQQVCRPCRQHSDCEGELICENGSRCVDSMVCISGNDVSNRDGHCAANGPPPSGHVLYVNNGGACQDGDTGLRFNAALCTLDAAMSRANSSSTQLQYVRVLGGAYQAPGAVSGRLVFIGAPGKGTKGLAVVLGMDILFSMSGASELVLEQLDLLEESPQTTAVICNIGAAKVAPRLAMRHNILKGSTPFDSMGFIGAVTAHSCRVHLDGNFIGLTSLSQIPMQAKAHGAGVVITDSGFPAGASYLLENNVIAGNVAAGLDMSGARTGRIMARFNTIWGNGRNIGEVGIVCPRLGLERKEISYSIIAKNSRGNGSQVAEPNGCSFNQVVVGSQEPSNADGLIKREPELDDSFHLPDTDLASKCCIDQAMNVMSGQFPAWDIDRQPRPQNKLLDIGADEFTRP